MICLPLNYIYVFVMYTCIKEAGTRVVIGSDSPECQQLLKIDWAFCFHVLGRCSSSLQKITCYNWCTVTAQVIYIKRKIYNARERGRKMQDYLKCLDYVLAWAHWYWWIFIHGGINILLLGAAVYLRWICVALNACLINTEPISA